MKKVIIFTLIASLFFSIPFPVNAQLIDENELPQNITILDKEDVLTQKMRQELEKEERELAEQGIYKTKEVYYIENQDINIIDPVMSLQATKNSGKIAKVVHSLRTYSSETQELSKSSKGMSYWLDVVWNLAIGSKTKYAWKAATILGINPSNISSKRMKGDSLKRTYQYAYHDYIYYGENWRDKKIYQCMKTTRLELTTYVDLYTFTKQGKAYRKSASGTSTYKTQHYADTTFIKQQCLENAMFSGMSVYQDTFK